MRLITCSNSYPRWDAGKLLPRSPGGLVPMLIALLQRHGGQWIFTAPPDLPAVDEVSVDGGIQLHPMAFDEQTRHQHYDVVSIRLFLGMLHYMHDTAVEPVFDRSLLAAWDGYEAVNRAYAKRLDELATGEPDELILINDPHLMLVPEFFVQRRGPLTYFLGTPWCEPDYFGILPAHIRVRLLESLLRCDTVGFHAERWVDAFLACCTRYLPDAEVSGRVVRYRGRTTTLVAVPFPLDVDVVERLRDAPATDRWRAELALRSVGRRTMVRADRLDLWKNIPRGFLAYEAMLERRPELAESCWFAAVVTMPTRAADRHRVYQEQCEALVRRINDRFGTPAREAVSLIYPASRGDSRNCVAAALTMSRAAIVNSTYDGLNLFAKEAALLLDDRASLLLSVNAGVYEQLAPHSVALDPFDIDQTSRAMEAALGDPDGHDGSASAAARRELLHSETAERWLAAVFPA
ncbi:trehalose-6-phosphate synthase [Actinophytocola sp.]|uniref:trehalose-6-phosphate synthase n=1 Tax=Actinophytocola sp. TaxID=1872138 RepID=UPI00389B09AD